MKTNLQRSTLSSIQEKRALLGRLLRRAAEPQPETPLSYGQKAMYFLNRSTPESAAYHVAFTARVLSPVDAAALRRALQSLVERHEQLRATFVLRDGEPVQEIAPRCLVAFEQADASSWSDEQLDQGVREAYRQPFDLELGPVFRAHLFTLAERDHVLLITVHHIVYDAWSLWLNQDELAVLYAAETAGRPALLPRPDKFYRDFIRWQNDMLAGPEGGRLWSYWEDRLRGELPTLNLPTDRPRPPVQTFSGASREFALPGSLCERLKAYARECDVTPFTLYLAAFQVLLHRYTGQEDILVGSPAAGSDRGDFANVVGYFVNPLVLRADLSGNPTFESFLAQVKETVLGALEHRDFPFPLLVERLQPRRDPSYSPLFQVLFVYQRAQRARGTLNLMAETQRNARLNFGGLELARYEMPQQEGQFDLELEMFEAGPEMIGSFKYNTDLFDASTVDRAIAHLETLLKGILAEPNRPVGLLPLLPESERRLLAESFNATAVDYDLSKPLHELIEAQVAKTPEAIAVSFGECSLTYRELNHRSNQLANYLRALGIGPDVLVAVCMERSLEMVIALLGTLKAGGAYLPLDPALPVERLAFMLADARAAFILTRSTCAGGLPRTGIRMLPLDTLWYKVAAMSPVNPKSRVRPHHLAYVIYTSGSTGKPKGVQIEHSALSNFLYAMGAALPIGPDDSLLAVTTLSFDIAALELYLPLTVGARILLAGREEAMDGLKLLGLLDGATFLQATPATWQMLLQAGWESSTDLHMLCGGEALPPDLAAQLLGRGRALWNMYGPTETTVWSTMTRVPEAGDVSIGRPIANTRIHILDKWGQPTPIGVPGELHIGGANVARGYLNRAELTAEKFIPDPFAAALEARLYKTGDLARWRQDGTIEYLGRLDFQVKIRGFRIELGEIEQTLCQHPQVVESVVVTRNAPSGDLCLVGYVTGPESTPESAEELRRFLKERLPDYCVPAVLVVLGYLPLSHNGKVDRGALPAPELWSGRIEMQVATPRDACERTVARIWEDVLGIRPIGLFDNFFDLGGHSLRALRLMADIQKELGIALPLATLFKAPTVEQLAAVIRQGQTESSWSPLVPIQPKGGRPPFFCVAGGGGSVLYYQPLARYLGSDQPFYGLQAKGLDGESRPFDQVDDMAACYLEGIRSVQPKGPYRLGGHCFGAVVAFEMAQQLIRSGEEVALLVVLNVPAPRHGRSEAVRDLDDAAWVVKLGRLLEQTSGQDLALSYEDIKLLDSETQLEHLRNRMLHAGFLPPEAGVAPVRGLVQVLKANGRIEYVPEDPARIPIALLRAEEFHHEYDYSSAEYPVAGERDETLGWGAYASGPVSVQAVPGDHITILVEPNVKRLAARLGTLLAGTCGNASVDPEHSCAGLVPSTSAGQESIPVRYPEAENPIEKFPARFGKPAPTKYIRRNGE